VQYEEAAERMMNAFASSHHLSPINKFQKFTKGEIFALNFLAMRSDEVRAGDFSAVMRASSARVAAMLRNLEDKGLIERRHDMKDRRQVMVTITDAGREFIQSQRDEMFRQLTEAFRRMGPEDTEDFLRLTVKFFEIMSESEDGNPGFGECSPKSEDKDPRFAEGKPRFGECSPKSEDKDPRFGEGKQKLEECDSKTE